MTAMLCAVIMLITLLMEKLFIVREKGEIAMMKSIGFRNSSIRSWQVIRMILVALVSMLAAVPLSMLSNRFMATPIIVLKTNAYPDNSSAGLSDISGCTAAGNHLCNDICYRSNQAYPYT